MRKIGELNPEIYGMIAPVLTTDVVITDRQIEHVKQRHPNDFEMFQALIPQILRDPDYLFRDNQPNTALAVGVIETDGFSSICGTKRLFTERNDWGIL